MAAVDGSAINLFGAAETISADIQHNRKDDVHAEVTYVNECQKRMDLGVALGVSVCVCVCVCVMYVCSCPSRARTLFEAVAPHE